MSVATGKECLATDSGCYHPSRGRTLCDALEDGLREDKQISLVINLSRSSELPANA